VPEVWAGADTVLPKVVDAAGWVVVLKRLGAAWVVANEVAEPATAGAPGVAEACALPAAAGGKAKVDAEVGWVPAEVVPVPAAKRLGAPGAPVLLAIRGAVLLLLGCENPNESPAVPGVLAVAAVKLGAVLVPGPASAAVAAGGCKTNVCCDGVGAVDCAPEAWAALEPAVVPGAPAP
jgi:hypothetical protein